jgi:hypothetical protein
VPWSTGASAQETCRGASAGREPHKPRKPHVKPRRVIQAAALVAKPYLEAQDDIDAYLDKLRTALEELIAEGDRIEMR